MKLTIDFENKIIYLDRAITCQQLLDIIERVKGQDSPDNWIIDNSVKSFKYKPDYFTCKPKNIFKSSDYSEEGIV